MSYTEEVYERVVAQNPGEPEFHPRRDDQPCGGADRQRARLTNGPYIHFASGFRSRLG